MTILIVMVVILVAIVIVLMLYNIKIHKSLEQFKNTSQKVNSLNVLQEFMNTIGNEIPVDEKINQINDILIEKLNLKYSTIVIFDGAEYTIKASNVDKKHWETLKNLQNEEIFEDSISTATPKYITVNNETERLPYQKMEFGRAKSAMFFPLYIDNVYIGYWIIESGVMHAFDNTDTVILEIVKDNIISVYKTVSYQNIVENTNRIDLFSNLNSEQYLYGEGRKIIDQYTTSTVCMFSIINLPDINNKFNRKTGDEIIKKVSSYIQKSISDEYIFIRYMGPKFVIVFSGIDTNGVAEFISDIKSDVEKIKIPKVKLEYELKKEQQIEKQTKKVEKIKKQEILASPRLNVVLTTYYKGTALEIIMKKLEEYIDTAKGNESDINYI